MKNAPDVKVAFDSRKDERASVRVDSETARAITEKASRVTERAQEHFEKHRTSWVTRTYGKMLKLEGNTPSLHPHGAVSDSKTRLMNSASHHVDRKQAKRLMQINRSAKNMLEGKPVRSKQNIVER